MRLRAADLILVGSLALVVRLFAAWAIPHAATEGDPNCAPDEAAHLEVVKHLAAGHAPSWPAVHTPYPAYVPLCYAPQALALAILPRLGLDRPALYRFPVARPEALGFPLARAGSALAGAAAALLVALAAAAWTGERLSGIAAGLLAALLPQLVFLSAYVNGDIATLAGFAALLLAVARWARAGEGEEGLVAVALTSGAVLLLKPYGFAFLPGTAVWVLASLARRRVALPIVARAAALSGALVLPILGWNAARNGGDVLGTRTFDAFLAENPAVWKVASAYPDPLPGFVAMTTKSSFAVFGNNSVSLPPAFYAIAALLLAAGLGMAAASLRSAGPVSRRGALWLISGVVLGAALAFHMSWFVNYQPQGRYVMPAVLALSLAALLAPAALLRGRARWSVTALGLLFLSAALYASLRLLVLRPC